MTIARDTQQATIASLLHRTEGNSEQMKFSHSAIPIDKIHTPNSFIKTTAYSKEGRRGGEGGEFTRQISRNFFRNLRNYHRRI